MKSLILTAIIFASAGTTFAHAQVNTRRLVLKSGETRVLPIQLLQSLVNRNETMAITCDANSIPNPNPPQYPPQYPDLNYYLSLSDEALITMAQRSQLGVCTVNPHLTPGLVYVLIDSRRVGEYSYGISNDWDRQQIASIIRSSIRGGQCRL